MCFILFYVTLVLKTGKSWSPGFMEGPTAFFLPVTKKLTTVRGANIRDGLERSELQKEGKK